MSLRDTKSHVIFNYSPSVFFCSYDFVIPEDGQWGAEINETGNWTGIVGNLQHKVGISKFCLAIP